MGIESFIDQEQQTSKMLRSFLLRIIAENKETSETCNIILKANVDGKAYFLATNSKGYILDDNGQIEQYETSDIAGFMMYNAFGSIIETYLCGLVERIKKHFNINNEGVKLFVYGTDKGCNELVYFIYDKENKAVQVNFSEQDYIENLIYNEPETILKKEQVQNKQLSKSDYEDYLEKRFDEIINSETHKKQNLFFIFNFD